MQSHVLVTVELSVCPSVCLSLAGAVSKRRKLGSRNLHRRIAQGLVLAVKAHPEIRKGSPRGRALNESEVGKIRNFRHSQ